MTAVILTIHTLIVLALVGVVLLQRSEGGALGIGGGGGGGMMSGRGAANVLTRSTTVLAALFFTTSMVLALISDRGETDEELFERTVGTTVEDAVSDPSEINVDDILDFSDTPDVLDEPAIELPSIDAVDPAGDMSDDTGDTPVE